MSKRIAIFVIAYDAVTTHDDVLVVSASGDGGYHEVVNGVVRAGREGATSGAARW